MSRRIVFAGGSQTRALARIFRGEIAGQTGDDVVFIGTGAVGTDAARSTLLLADVLVMEVDEDGDAVPAAELPEPRRNCARAKSVCRLSLALRRQPASAQPRRLRAAWRPVSGRAWRPFSR